MPRSQGSPDRPQLSRERVLRAAVAVADGGGLGGLTIRSLAVQLDVQPMSVYYYVANKSEILDGIVELVFAEIELPTPGGEWRAEITKRAHSAREVLRRHPWAIALMESRTNPAPATLHHHNATVGTFREAGFPVPLAAHAYALLDAFIYGFVLQETTLPFEGSEDAAEVAGSMMENFESGQYPYLTELVTEHILQPGYAFGDEFDFGLDLVLDGLARSLPVADGGTVS